jgi:hypothetical protein
MNGLYRKNILGPRNPVQNYSIDGKPFNAEMESKDTNFAENSLLECSLLSVHINLLHSLLFYLAARIS